MDGDGGGNQILVGSRSKPPKSNLWSRSSDWSFLERVWNHLYRRVACMLVCSIHIVCTCRRTVSSRKRDSWSSSFVRGRLLWNCVVASTRRDVGLTYDVRSHTPQPGNIPEYWRHTVESALPFRRPVVVRLIREYWLSSRFWPRGIVSFRLGKSQAGLQVDGN